MQIGIIGTGYVGMSVAVSLAYEGVARELLLADVHAELAEGEAMDLSHGAPFLPAVQVRSGAIEDMRDCDAVVIAAGRSGRPGQSRLELLEENALLIRELGQVFRGFRGLLIMVTNPVDVLTHVLAEASGVPYERVIGTGTLLDTARIRYLLAQELKVSVHSVHLNIVGEHGDSQVPLFSSAHVGGVSLRSWPGYSSTREPEVASSARRAASEIIRRKGATNHAIGLVTAHLLKWALRDEGRILCVSRVQTGAWGLHDVALSLPSRVGRLGAQPVDAFEFDPQEHQALLRSAETLREAKARLGAPR